MRLLYLPDTSNDPTLRPWRFWSGFSAIILIFALTVIAIADPQTPNSDPMEDKYSQKVREEYAKCRKEKNPMSQFFCTCRVLDKQCEAPRRLEHGYWNTVEYWPSDDEAEREVQFVLLADYDILGDFSPVNKGIVVTCIAGVSNFNIFVGGNVDPDKSPLVMIDTEMHEASFENEDGSWILDFEKSEKAFKALRSSKEMAVNFIDMDNDDKSLEFDTFGFDNVSKGWEKLCMSVSS